MRMRVPFDDFATGIERGRIQRVRELAETAADRRDDAAFAQLAPFYVSGAAGGATDLSPTRLDCEGQPAPYNRIPAFENSEQRTSFVARPGLVTGDLVPKPF